MPAAGPKAEYANQLHDERNVYPLPNIPARPIWLLNPPESLGQFEKGAYLLPSTRADRIWLVGLQASLPTILIDYFKKTR